MPLPIYNIELINSLREVVLSYVDGVAGSSFGTASIQKRGQTFLTTGAWTVCCIELTQVSISGTPTDSLQVKIYESDKSTLIATSINTIIGSTIPTFPAVKHLIFEFDSVELLDATTYFFEISRTGSLDGNNYYRVKYNVPSVYADGSEWYYNGSWIEQATVDLNFIMTTLEVDETDITEDVKSIQSINTGLNGVYGSIKQGQALLKIKNVDSKYSPLNDSSPLFNKFRIGNEIKIEVEYNSVTYNLFKGTIDNLEPKLNYDERTVDVKLLDRFSEFKETTVSIGTQTAKTTTELIEALLVAAGLTSSEYSLDTIVEVQQTVTWDEVNLIDKLNEVVEAGQHYHFMDGNGIYQLKSNQFLSDDTPDFEYNDTDNDPGEVKQNYALSDVKNTIEVEYTGSNFEQREDTDSQSLFGIRESIFENNLINTQVRAGFIADYILSLLKDAGNIIEMNLFLLKPDVFKIDFGTVVKLTDSFHDIDNVYNVLERTFSRPEHGKETLKIKARKYVFPPLITVELEPFQDDALIDLQNTMQSCLQGFKVVNDGQVIKWSYKIKTDVTIAFNIEVTIFELDGSGFPTGSVLATSNNNVINFPSYDDTMEFTFPADERPTLDSTKTYGMLLTTSPLGRFTNFKLRGKTTDVYADGKPAEKIASSWSTRHPADFYFKAEIQEV